MNIGIAVCGSGVGAFVFAPFCQLLLNIFEWKGALIIISAMALNCAVFGALMRPLKIHAQAFDDSDENEEQKNNNGECETCIDTTNDANNININQNENKLSNFEPGVQSCTNLNKIINSNPYSFDAETKINKLNGRI